MIVGLFSRHQYLLECSCYSDSSDESAFTSNAFIFSLHNKEDLGPFKSMVTNPSRAIAQLSHSGPTFGDRYDIRIANNANKNTNSYTGNFGAAYSVPSGVQDRRTILAGTSLFRADEVEVFYIG